VKHDRQAQPPLGEEDVERYSRQIIVPGVGASGQAKLLGSTVAVIGNRSGIYHASRYLEASGVAVVSSSDNDADCYIMAGIDEIDVEVRSALLSRQPRLTWYAIDRSRIVSGCDWRSADGYCASTPRSDDATSDAGLHAVAACDAAAATIAALLGWTDLETPTEVDLA